MRVTGWWDGGHSGVAGSFVAAELSGVVEESMLFLDGQAQL